LLTISLIADVIALAPVGLVRDAAINQHGVPRRKDRLKRDLVFLRHGHRYF
jgi:hypothetical protein